MKATAFIFCITFFFGCQNQDFVRFSANQTGFGVTAMQMNYSNLTQLPETIIVELSRVPLLADLQQENIIVCVQADVPSDLNNDWDEIIEDVQDGQVINLVQDVSLIETQKLLVTLNVISNGDYSLLILPSLKSQEYLPLDQTFYGSNLKVYQNNFTVTQVEDIFESVLDNETIFVDVDEYPDVAQTIDEISEVIESEEIPFNWGRILITEVVTSPQQDYNDSTSGDGVLFNEWVGNGSITTSDEYIEIFNGTGISFDVSQWNLIMQDGTDETELLSDNLWDVLASAGGDVSNFNPGEVLVLGNPRGSINNNVSLTLLDDQAFEIDYVQVEEAESYTLESDSYYRNTDGEFEFGLATPGDL